MADSEEADLATQLAAWLLEDSRLIRRYNDLQHGLNEEMEFLANLRDETWQVIAGTCGLSTLELRTEVLGAAHRSISFMDFRFFSVVRARPWSLASGDVDQQLDALSSEEEEPSDPISAQVWKMLRSLHYNREKLRQAINFLGEINGILRFRSSSMPVAPSSENTIPKLASRP